MKKQQLAMALWLAVAAAAAHVSPQRRRALHVQAWRSGDGV